MGLQLKSFERDFEKWKVEYLAEYCMSKCDKTCCDMHNVSLSVNENELIMIYGEKILPEHFKVNGIKPIHASGMYSIETKTYCRHFDESTRKCLIYDKRPMSCRTYPFFVEKDSILIKSGCSLTKGGMAYKKLLEIASSHRKVVIKRAGR